MTHQFGDLLRDWRTRRRYSQMALALEANISARHLCCLEKGKSKPSRAMVGQLSNTLDVPRSDRNRLLQAAGFAPAYAERNWDAQDLDIVRGAVSHMLRGHDPYPAFALNRHWQLLQLNSAAERLVGALGLGVGDSMLDAITKAGHVADSVENLGQVRVHMQHRLQSESAHLGGDTVLDAARARLIALIEPDVAPMIQPAIVPVIFKLGEMRLSLFTMLANFSSVEDIALADMKIELMFPADEKTRQFLEMSAQN